MLFFSDEMKYSIFEIELKFSDIQLFRDLEGRKICVCEQITSKRKVAKSLKLKFCRKSVLSVNICILFQFNSVAFNINLIFIIIF